jgi:hypothetical protein
MAHLKNQYISVMQEEHCPNFISMRKSALTVFGGTLPNLYNLHGSDSYRHRSRIAGHSTHKDFRINGQRNYKPWQRS